MWSRFAGKSYGPARAIILALCFLASLAEAAFAHYEPFETTGAVVSNNDGYALKVRTVSGDLLTLRLAGADTPERGQAYWKVAKSQLASLTRGGITVGCYKSDRYERYVCREYAQNRDVGLELVRQELARHSVQFLTKGTTR